MGSVSKIPKIQFPVDTIDRLAQDLSILHVHILFQSPDISR